MIQKKYLLATVIPVALSFISLVHANGTESGYKAPITTEKFGFTAVLNDGKVDMTWKRFDSFSDESLQYYKVVRSSNNPKPVYPEDGYIKYDTDMEFTSYTDNEPKKGINYYRVCAITTTQNRYCSNVVKIELSKTIVKEGVKPIKETIKEEKKDTTLNKKVDALVSQFEAKLNEKFGTDTEKKTAIINGAIARLETLKSNKPHMTTVVDLVIAKLKELLARVDTGDIEAILTI